MLYNKLLRNIEDRVYKAKSKADQFEYEKIEVLDEVAITKGESNEAI